MNVGVHVSYPYRRVLASGLSTASGRVIQGLVHHLHAVVFVRMGEQPASLVVQRSRFLTLIRGVQKQYPIAWMHGCRAKKMVTAIFRAFL